MSTLRNLLRAAALCAIACTAACGGDDEPSKAEGTLDAGLDGGGGQVGAVGDGGTPAEAPLYVVGSYLTSGMTSAMYTWTTREFENAKFDIKDARELGDVSELVAYNGFLYVPDTARKGITRFSIQDDKLVEGPFMSLADTGLQFVSYTHTILSPERAFIVDSSQWTIVEWNPTTMTITKTHDISALKKEGWGNEYRGGFVRDDGKFIFYWAYTNKRIEYINTLTVGVWDTTSNTLTIEEDPTCPTTAGFGGYLDEQGDLYLIADSFGLFTQFGGFKDPKPACVVRVKKGESKLDPTFKVRPSEAMGGHFPFGFYYVGNGLAFTSGVDPAIIPKYKDVFEVLFAKEHSGWVLDLKNGTGKKVEDLPKDGVSFESFKRIDNRLFVPRVSGDVEIQDIKSTDSTLWEVRPDATAKKVLSLPGQISVTRVR